MRRQTTNKESEEDEYDVDYDNLVVSDILGTSGLPGLPFPKGPQGSGGQSRQSNTFSLYDFS